MITTLWTSVVFGALLGAIINVNRLTQSARPNPGTQGPTRTGKATSNHDLLQPASAGADIDAEHVIDMLLRCYEAPVAGSVAL